MRAEHLRLEHVPFSANLLKGCGVPSVQFGPQLLKLFAVVLALSLHEPLGPYLAEPARETPDD